MRLSWARLLKRVFEIDHCPNCGGELKIIAAILEQPVIEKILTHLGLQARAPPRVPPRGQAHAGCLTLPKRDCLGGPSSRAAGCGCARGFSGPMDAALWQGVTRRRHPQRRFSAGLSTPNRSALHSNAVGRRVLPFSGCHGQGKGAFEKSASSERGEIGGTDLLRIADELDGADAQVLPLTGQVEQPLMPFVRDTGLLSDWRAGVALPPSSRNYRFESS